MSRPHLPLLALLVLLAACTIPPGAVPDPGPPVPPPEEDSCGAAQYADLVGQDATALERVLIMREVRLIRPGQTVTMEYRAQRINFQIDAADTISRITCG